MYTQTKISWKLVEYLGWCRINCSRNGMFLYKGFTTRTIQIIYKLYFNALKLRGMLQLFENIYFRYSRISIPCLVQSKENSFPKKWYCIITLALQKPFCQIKHKKKLKQLISSCNLSVLQYHPNIVQFCLQHN